MLRRSCLLFCVPHLSAVYGRSFTVSSRVWHRINEKNGEEGFQNDQRFLRLAVDSGGCHGYKYHFSFEENDALVPEEDVVVAETDVLPVGAEGRSGVEPPPRVVVDRHSLTKLQAAVIDFHSELKGAAFVVVGNELVDESCACAMSFSIKKRQPQK
ncbi:putative Iron-sulfur assembly protein 2 [Trypanosoma cruzi]|nr:putative Iron-sulfur assembly protein 2 [Trypanosoma cruzi]